jgi:hypothetical protein
VALGLVVIGLVSAELVGAAVFVGDGSPVFSGVGGSEFFAAVGCSGRRSTGGSTRSLLSFLSLLSLAAEPDV